VEHATKEHSLVDGDLEPKFIAKMPRRLIEGLILYVIANVVSFLNTHLSIILFALIPIYYLGPTRSL
jgi:hypothetical protein